MRGLGGGASLWEKFCMTERWLISYGVWPWRTSLFCSKVSNCSSVSSSCRLKSAFSCTKKTDAIVINDGMFQTDSYAVQNPELNLTCRILSISAVRVEFSCEIIFTCCRISYNDLRSPSCIHAHCLCRCVFTKRFECNCAKGYRVFSRKSKKLGLHRFECPRQVNHFSSCLSFLFGCLF